MTVAYLQLYRIFDLRLSKANDPALRLILIELAGR
jgi:hypothetical protein